MEGPTGNIWDSPKHRAVVEDAARSIAKVFRKEDEFDAFIKARDKYIAAMKDGITDVEYVALRQSPEYQALQQEYRQANPDWLEPVVMALAKLYKQGLDESSAP